MQCGKGSLFPWTCHKCGKTELHATHQNCANCEDTICKQCACGMAVAAVSGDTGVVLKMVGNHTIYFCDQDCAAEHTDFASNKAGKHHECTKCKGWAHQALRSKCTECAKYFHLTCNWDQIQFGHKQCSKACEQTAPKHI